MFRKIGSRGMIDGNSGVIHSKMILTDRLEIQGLKTNMSNKIFVMNLTLILCLAEKNHTSFCVGQKTTVCIVDLDKLNLIWWFDLRLEPYNAPATSKNST